MVPVMLSAPVLLSVSLPPPVLLIPVMVSRVGRVGQGDGAAGAIRSG